MAQAKPEDKMPGSGPSRLTATGGNDRRRHQRRPGVPSRRGTGHEQRHFRLQGSCQHVDLDSDPTKLIEVIAIGKQLLITRGAITTFSIANDVAKYFAILPAMFVVAYPELNQLNIMGLSNPQSAILSAVIFNALIIVALVPLSLRGVAYRPRRPPTCCGATCSSTAWAASSPFLGIKAIDLLVTALHLA